ncbi:MAG: hypothetical protein IPL92_13090 [Saprospiraceae bacterium]|nr:hypothetical protein [Candidatus Opimibacter iunctus]
MDEVTIFDGVLSDAAVASLYADQSTAPVAFNELVAAYSFSGNTRDESSYANHASGGNISIRLTVLDLVRKVSLSMGLMPA